MQISKKCINRLGLILPVLILTACAGMQPVIYPNEHSRSVGSATLQEDIEACEKLATEAGADEQSNAAVGQVAKAGAVGAASGAVGGAIAGSAGEGAAIGAASAAATQLIYDLFDGPDPNPVYQHFVSQCLIDKGYQVSGWN